MPRSSRMLSPHRRCASSNAACASPDHDPRRAHRRAVYAPHRHRSDRGSRSPTPAGRDRPPRRSGRDRAAGLAAPPPRFAMRGDADRPYRRRLPYRSSGGSTAPTAKNFDTVQNLIADEHPRRNTGCALTDDRPHRTRAPKRRNPRSLGGSRGGPDAVAFEPFVGDEAAAGMD